MAAQTLALIKTKLIQPNGRIVARMLCTLRSSTMQVEECDEWDGGESPHKYILRNDHTGQSCVALDR